MTGTTASAADRPPYSLCSGRKSLSQQLDGPAGKAGVRPRRGAGPTRGAGAAEEDVGRFPVHRTAGKRVQPSGHGPFWERDPKGTVIC